MKTTSELAAAVEEAVRYMRSQQNVREAEAFASSNGQLICRLNYTSHLVCNGVQEPKSVTNFGIGLQVALERNGRVLSGFGQEAGDIGGVHARADAAFEILPARHRWSPLHRPRPATPQQRHHGECQRLLRC